MLGEHRIRSSLLFSVCTLVTRPAQYENMRTSFIKAGFGEDTTEYLFHDNTEANSLDAYEAINKFLLEARGDSIVICHQDVTLLSDGAEELTRQIARMNRDFPHWAVLGNAGASASGQIVIRISDPGGENQTRGGPFPARVVSVDENFIVIRREANLAVSRDVGGFHYYGADLCIIADVLGWESYVIDFHLRHYSSGDADSAFHSVKLKIQAKYARAFRERWVHGTLAYPFFLASTPSRQRRALTLSRLAKALGIAPRRSRITKSIP